MTKKIGDKKIGGVKTADHASQVAGTQSVHGVAQVKATSGIGGVQGTSGIRGRRRPTRVMSPEERERLFELVDQEAEKLFAQGTLTESKRDLVRSAVKMAVDSGLTDDGGEDDTDAKPKSS